MSSSSLSQILFTKYGRLSIVSCAALASLFFLYQFFKPGAPASSLSHGSNWNSGVKVSSGRQQSLDDIKNSTLGFEKILAINLPERTDHRDGLVLATALSDISVEFMDGVRLDTILPKVLPTDYHQHDKLLPWVGGWRAHINAISRVVQNNWKTALIIEDDVDWDIRLKSQLQEFAIASDYLLRTDNQNAIGLREISTSHIPTTSPYGDGWDVLWLGHCGMELAQNSPTVFLGNDPTVPEVQHYLSWDVTAQPPLKDYPPHTRAVMSGHQGTCSLAYAVSQNGARKLLYSLGIEHLNEAFDLMLRQWCEGVNGHEKHTCISVLPQLLDHHRRAGSKDADSDISKSDGSIRASATTPNIRWSVRLNVEKLLRGETDYVDQYPDSVP